MDNHLERRRLKLNKRSNQPSPFPEIGSTGNNSVTTAPPYDNISLEDARKLYETLMKQQVLSKYNFPTKPSSDGYYHTYVADSTKKTGRRAIKAKTLEELREKVFSYENGISGTTRKTFRIVFEIVQSEKLKYIKNPEKVLSVKNTLRREQWEYHRYFEGTRLEKLFVDEISKHDIEDVCLMNLQRYDMTYKAFLSMRTIIKNVLKLAFNEYWISENPYDRVDFKKYKDMLVKPAPTEERVHSDKEITLILDYIHEKQRKQPSQSTPYALELQLLTGFRRGEIPPLEFSDIHENYLMVSKEQLIVAKDQEHSSQFNAIVNHTKTYKDRKFPITNEVQDCLERIYAFHDRYYPDSKYLFPKSGGKEPISNNTVYSFYYRMCRCLGIELSHGAKKGPHSFRRNGITKVINESGGNIIMASKLFGNTPDVANANYYAGLDLNQAKAVLES